MKLKTLYIFSSKSLLRNLLILALPCFILISCQGNKIDGILVEAESFTNKGGWVVDPQFVEQMGSPYLLAHGLGAPVENAKTKITLPANNTYHVWARTINWAPGLWDAPGRFKIKVNEQTLKTSLGTKTGWNWQYAGRFENKDQDITLELHDLTGFEGRCDAIYISTRKKMPPNQKDKLAIWRKEQLGETGIPTQTKTYDVVIVGGGIAGCAAAIAAAEQNLKVVLIHDRPILGGNASSEIRVHTLGIKWRSERILKMIDTEHWKNGSPDSKKDDQKRHKYIESYDNISLFLNWRAYTSNTMNDSITSIDARQTATGETKRFKAPIFIDCTGDGWVGYWAGAEYMYGREEASKYNEALEEHGDLWSPNKADNRVMGSSVLWRSSNAGKPVTFPKVPWAMEVARQYNATKGGWRWEYSNNNLHQIEDAEKIRDHMFKAIYGSFYNAKQNVQNANLQLKWVSYLLGKRESRRLKGDYIYTFQDARQMTEFPDAVVMEKREIDVHYQQNLKDTSKVDFLSNALFYDIDHYYIPYRSLYSKNIKNLLMAGRSFSCSHIGLGGPRVMNTTGQMGVAVGYAASLCKKYNVMPRGVYEHYIEELKTMLIKNSSPQ